MPDASEAGPPRTQRRFTLSRRQGGAAPPPANLGPSPTSTPTRRLPFYLGGDVLADAAARLPFTAAGRAAYADDWTSGAFWGVLAPATHVCLLSLIPALAFGEQAAEETGGAVTGASVLASTALFGVAQALVGGQPLLIVGVAEPLVLLYAYLAAFARRASLPFLPFAAWSCAWAAAFLAAAALGGAGRGVSRFTRFSSDLFGALVGGALFMQQAVALVVRQFRGGGEGGGGGSEEAARAWALANGTWGLFIAVGLLATILAARRARGWSVGPPGLRALVAEVAAPLGVAAWSGVAYAVRAPTAGALVPPPGILPRPLTLPAPWEAGPMSAWSVAGRMGGLGAKWAAAAAIPGLMVAVLFYFDHTIVQRVALPDGCSPPPPAGGPAGGSTGGGGDARPPPPPPHQAAHHHKRPTYAWDLAALSLMTLAAGLLGLPPVNGVLPQAPMHTHALAVAAREHESRAARRRAKRPGGTAAAGPLPGPPPPPRPPLETRVAALLQSLAIGAAAGVATPLLARIPQAVIAGYFAFMALESLEANQFALRLRFLAAHPTSRPALASAPGAPACLSTVPLPPLRSFTLLQLAALAALYGWTWIPLGGIFFPVLLLGLVPVRAFILPRFFSPASLTDLDAAEYEEAPPTRPPLPVVPSFTGLEPVRVLGEAEMAARVAAEMAARAAAETKAANGGGV